MTDKEALATQLKAMVLKAKRALESGSVLLKEDDSEGASSKAYYAVFHMLQAALLTKGLSYSKHSGVLGGFSQHFVKPGLFPEELAMIIRRLRKDREVGDHDYVESISSEEASRDLEQAAKIVVAVEQFLQPYLR